MSDCVITINAFNNCFSSMNCNSYILNITNYNCDHVTHIVGTVNWARDQLISDHL